MLLDLAERCAIALIASSRSGGLDEGLKVSACTGSVLTIGLDVEIDPDREGCSTSVAELRGLFASKAVVDADGL